MKLLLYLFAVLLLLSSASAIKGTTTLLTVIDENASRGGTASVELEILPGSGRVFFDSYPLSQIDTQISARYAKEIACSFLELDCSELDFFYTIKSGSSVVGGPSAGGAFTVLTVSLLDNQKMAENVAMTGTINSGGSIGSVGGVEAKINAAKTIGLNKVLVPIFSNYNVSDIEVIEVYQLSDALYYFTGKNYSKNYFLTENPEYNALMQGVAEEICETTEKFMTLDLDKNTTEYNFSIRFKEFSLNASLQNDYYSAASFCFSANIRLRQLSLNKVSLQENSLIYSINELKNQIADYEKKLAAHELNELTELETYMIVKERLDESKTIANELNMSNISVRDLAYAIERYNSAVSWSAFFSLEGREVDIDLEYLETACYKKLDEVEERTNLVRVLLPTYENLGTEDAKETAISGDYGLCLFKATKAKAEINALIGVVAVNNSDVEELIMQRLILAESAIAKEQEKGNFPILAFSYLNYAGKLVGEDDTNALIFSEYALEFSDLGIYFPQKLEKARVPESNNSYSGYLLSGFFLGLTFSLAIYLILRKKPRK